MRPFLAAILFVMLLAGCGTKAPKSPGAATVTATSTVTVSSSAAVTSPAAAATPADAGLAARLAALACQDYVFSGTLDAASGSAPLDEAASTGTSAAVVDPSWTDLAGALGFMAALPLTDNTSADIDRSTTQIAVIRSRCNDAGITVS